MRNAMRDKHKMCRVKIPIREIGADVLGLPTGNVLLGEALQLRIVSLYRAACFTSGPPTGDQTLVFLISFLKMSVRRTLY